MKQNKAIWQLQPAQIHGYGTTKAWYWMSLFTCHTRMYFNGTVTYYLIPESFEDNSIRLYKADQFPTQWSFLTKAG
jgi:hypothetical protein